jgi:RimJ/RimL family protein N-acetyltransferase
MGKGIGAKVLEKLISLCFCKMNLHKIEVSIAKNNEKSIKLFEKFGFQKEGVLRESLFKDGKYEDICLYGFIKKDNEK